MNPTTRSTRSAKAPTIEPLEARIAPAFAPVLSLGDLDGRNGFELVGGGFAVSRAGDVNGDGFGDIIIGESSDGSGGVSYVVFGKATGFGAQFNLAALNGSDGFRIGDSGGLDEAGGAVGAAGDFNGDGFDDLIVGGHHAAGAKGAAYVVFGKASGFAPTLLLNTLDGTNGFELTGVAINDYTGCSVSGAGDVNGDGLDDVIVGALQLSVQNGAAYVVFGTTTGMPANLNLGALDGTNGFKLTGVASQDTTGCSVSGAGDVNGDGFADVVVGAWRADPNGSASGASFVVFGKASGFAANLNLATLDGVNGFRLNGLAQFDNAGFSVSGAGDVNGDIFDDVIIGVPGGAGSVTNSGTAYVVFGKASGFAAILSLAALDGLNGFRVDGGAASDEAGASVRDAGDINRDGFADFIVGAFRADPSGSDSGASYVVLGKASGFTPSMSLEALDGIDGFKLTGIAAGDYSGRAVSGAGDINGDGFADLIVGVHEAGASYVIFGSSEDLVQIDPNTVQVIEADGDVVTVSLAGAKLGTQAVTFDPNGNIGKIDLTTVATAAQAAGGKAINLKLGVKTPAGGLGDGTTLVGQLDATGVKLGKVKLKGDLGQLIAGTGAGVLKLLKITGDFGKAGQTTEVKATVNALQVGGDLTGEVIADDFKKVTIGGNIGNGTLQAAGGIGSLKVAAKIVNSTLKLGTKIDTLLVLGDVENSTVRVKDAMTKLDVRGDVIDSEITVLGKLGVTSAAKAVALKSVKIGGDFVRSKLLAGYDANGAAMNADVSLGPITINGNFEASSIVAGATAGANGFFGDEDDALISGGGAVVAKIASITIKGSVLGSATLGDHFGLVAEEIAKLKIGGTTQTLTPGPGNDTTPIALGGTADVKVREVTAV